MQVQLKSCTDADSAATLIVKAAANQGIELSIADVVACFRAAPSLQPAAISDDELDLVAGGNYINDLQHRAALQREKDARIEVARKAVIASGNAEQIAAFRAQFG